MKRLILPALGLAAAIVVAACGDDGPKTFAEACEKSDEKQFREPSLMIDADKRYVATIETAKGDIQLELYTDTPITTNNFVFLACKGFYDGTTFHRVLPSYLAQGGDPEGTGQGGPGYSILAEDAGAREVDPGIISMARQEGNPDSAGSQFFITYTKQPRLTEQGYTVFGRLATIEALSVLRQLTPRNPDEDPGAPPGDIIKTIRIEER